MNYKRINGLYTIKTGEFNQYTVSISKELEIFLKKKKAFSKFVNNIKKLHNWSNFVTNLELAFTWDNTEEKHKYWEKLHIEFIETNK